MAKVITDNQYYSDIANAIRDKNGETTTYKPSEMADAIEAISGGGESHDVEDALVTRTITEYENGRVKMAGNYAFSGCYAMKSVSLPAVISIGAYAFQNCSELTNISFPVATSIGTYAFYSCINITSVSFPAVTAVGNGAFISCSALTEISLPAATSIDVRAFQSCSALTKISLPAATSIGEYAFYQSYKLTELIVGTNYSDKVCTYSNTSSSYDPANANLKIYVPDDLVDSYKSAKNWSRLASKIYGISERPTE